MAKYWHVILVGLQNTMVYRANFFFRAAFSLIPLLATIYLWKAIFASKGAESQVAHYTLGSMISYYLLGTVVDMLTAVNDDDWQIAADIREGTLSQFLLKPIDYLRYRLCLFTAGRLVYFVIAIIPVSVFIFFHREHLVPPPSGGVFLLFLVSITMTAMLQFFMSYMMALLAFWVLEVSTLIFILFAFEYVAGGHLFPIDILPPDIARVLMLTPFPYQFFFPINVYLGETTGPDLWQGLAVQAFWVVAFYGLGCYVWRRGVRTYTAFGG